MKLKILVTACSMLLAVFSSSAFAEDTMFNAVRGCEQNSQFQAFTENYRGYLANGVWEADHDYKERKQHVKIELKGNTLSWTETGKNPGFDWSTDENFHDRLESGQKDIKITGYLNS